MNYLTREPNKQWENQYFKKAISSTLFLFVVSQLSQLQGLLLLFQCRFLLREKKNFFYQYARRLFSNGTNLLNKHCCSIRYYYFFLVYTVNQDEPQLQIYLTSIITGKFSEIRQNLIIIYYLLPTWNMFLNTYYAS